MMVSNSVLKPTRFAGATLIMANPKKDFSERVAAVVKDKQTVLSMVHHDPARGVVDMLILYGRDALLFVHRYWGIELAETDSEDYCKSAIAPTMKEITASPQKMVAFSKQMVDFIEELEARKPEAIEYIDLTV